jgi:hypothetical protein
MIRREDLGVVAVVALLVAGVPRGGAMAQQASPRERVPPAPPDQDLRGIRNIFRYADEAPAEAHGRLLSDQTAEDDAETLAPPSRVRLVGFVERLDGLVAALAVDGEVVLLSKGDSAGGFMVLDVSDEAVILRTADGDRVTLQLP